MKKVRNLLRIAFFAVVFVALVIVCLFEWQVIWEGRWADDVKTDFVVECVMVLVTIVMIPFALRLFKFKTVHQSLLQKKENALKKWGMIRIMMLGVPMIVNVICYYLFSNTGYSYLALILFLSMLFIFPTLEKCYAETEPVEQPITETTPESE